MADGGLFIIKLWFPCLFVVTKVLKEEWMKRLRTFKEMMDLSGGKEDGTEDIWHRSPETRHMLS